MLLEQTCCFLLLTFPAQYVHFTRLPRLYFWWMILHNFSEVNGISTFATPSASATAFATAGVEPMVPASPTPFTPNGLTGVGVTVESVSKLGSSVVSGMA